MKTILRSSAAILVGWLVVVGGYLVTMIGIALFNRGAFQPAAHHSTGWWLIGLSVGFIFSVAGGFVAGAIAQRREIAHAIGLVLLGLLVYQCWPGTHASMISVPQWYRIACYVLLPSPVMGGWLRAQQHALAQRMPSSVVSIFANIRLSIALTIDCFRFPIALACSVATFVIGMRIGVLISGAALLGIQTLFGEAHRDTIIATPLALFGMFVLPFLPARLVYRRIMAQGSSVLKGK